VVLELALVVVDSAVVFAMPIIVVYLLALEYLGVAAESLAEPVLPLSHHVPVFAVCSVSDYLALGFLACSVVECLVGHVYLLLVCVPVLVVWLILYCLVLSFLARVCLVEPVQLLFVHEALLVA